MRYECLLQTRQKFEFIYFFFLNFNSDRQSTIMSKKNISKKNGQYHFNDKVSNFVYKKKKRNNSYVKLEIINLTMKVIFFLYLLFYNIFLFNQIKIIN